MERQNFWLLPESFGAGCIYSSFLTPYPLFVCENTSSKKSERVQRFKRQGINWGLPSRHCTMLIILYICVNSHSELESPALWFLCSHWPQMGADTKRNLQTVLHIDDFQSWFYSAATKCGHIFSFLFVCFLLGNSIETLRNGLLRLLKLQGSQTIISPIQNSFNWTNCRSFGQLMKFHVLGE